MAVSPEEKVPQALERSEPTIQFARGPEVAAASRRSSGAHLKTEGPSLLAEMQKDVAVDLVPARGRTVNELSFRTISEAALPLAPPSYSFVPPVGEASFAVHVHVGRIEINSGEPKKGTPDVPRPTKRDPMLSLDEYLRRRRGNRA